MDEKKTLAQFYNGSLAAEDPYSELQGCFTTPPPPPPPPSTARFHMLHPRPSKMLRRFLGAACISFLIWVTLRRVLDVSNPIFRPTTSADKDSFDFRLTGDENITRVPLEAHLMSKCPDARDCLQKLVIPAMERIHDKVDLTLSYIGSIDPDSDAVACKHGPAECLGNMILLCAAQLYPSPIMSLGFANCIIGSYKQIPDREFTEQCALEHGMDFSQINACISEEGNGLDLLRDSIERSQEKGVSISCTVRLADEVRCVRDGGQWKNCEQGSGVDDLVKDVERLYGGTE